MADRMTIKPSLTPTKPFAAAGLHREGDWQWLPLKAEWRNVAGKPEELV